MTSDGILQEVKEKEQAKVNKPANDAQTTDPNTYIKLLDIAGFV